MWTTPSAKVVHHLGGREVGWSARQQCDLGVVTTSASGRTLRGMFERSHEYPAFYVNSEHGGADEVPEGAVWLRDWPGADERLRHLPGPTQGAGVVSATGGSIPANAARPLDLVGRRKHGARTAPISHWTSPGVASANWPSAVFGSRHSGARGRRRRSGHRGAGRTTTGGTHAGNRAGSLRLARCPES
jgi:hypothetical protein